MTVMIFWLGMVMFAAIAIASSSLGKKLDRIAAALEKSPQVTTTSPEPDNG